MRGGIADCSKDVNNVLQCTFYRRFGPNRRKGRSGHGANHDIEESADNVKSRPEAALSEK
jgi:hypothetical protein